MDSQTYIDAIDTNGTRAFGAAESHLDAPVAACPGWDVAELLGHLGQVYAFVTRLVGAGSSERPEITPVAAPGGDANLAWVRDRHAELVDLLRSTAPDAPAWNWAGTGQAGFFHRRMAHETLIHRWDVEQAAGAPTPIDSDLGADCVDEVIEVGIQASANPNREFAYPAGSLHLHRTDGEGEWLLRVEDGRLIATREHAKGDVAVRGTGDNLALYMWGRGGEGLEIFGDPDLAEAWSQVAP